MFPRDIPRKAPVSILILFLVISVCASVCFAQSATPAAGAASGAERPAEGPSESSVSVSAHVSPDRHSFPAGRRFDVYLELETEGAGAAVEPGPIPKVKTSSNLELVDTASGNRRVTTSAGVTEVYYIRYTLQGTSPGEGTVKAADLKYRFKGEEEEQSLPSPVVSVTITPALPEGPPLWLKLLVAVGIPVVGLAAIGFFLFARRRKRRAETSGAAEEVPEWQAALDEARRKRYEGDRRAYLDALFDVLRRGLAAKLGLEGLPTPEALRARMQKEGEEEETKEMNARARRLLDDLEAARYAPETPPLEDLDRTAAGIEGILKTDREESRE